MLVTYTNHMVGSLPTSSCIFNILFQYFFDAGESESWMSEQELYMMTEDRAKDEMGAGNMLKKHGNLEKTVEDYADTVRQLGERARQLGDEGHPDRYLHS